MIGEDAIERKRRYDREAMRRHRRRKGIRPRKSVDSTPLPNEVWKPSRNSLYYEVSSLGRVRRSAPAIGATPGRIMIPQASPKGYLELVLRVNGKAAYRVVHRMVVEAFIGPIPSGMQVNHLNGMKADNRARNLGIVTPGENMSHALGMGLFRDSHVRGETHPFAKLSDSKVVQIRRLVLSGMTQKQVGQRFGVTQSAVSGVCRRSAWTHVDEDD